jgi:hypothetical protein
MMRYRFELDVVVTDVARLYESARVIEDDLERAGDPISEAEIEEQIGSREDPDIQACVETLFEPPTDSPPGTRHQWISEDVDCRSQPSLYGIGAGEA